MKALKTVGYYLLAALLTVLTLGTYVRFHLVTVRKRKLGGVRGGALGGKHVYAEARDKATFVVVSTWAGKNRLPVGQLNHTQTALGTVSVAMYGKRKAVGVFSWQASALSGFINDRISDTELTIAQA